VNQLPSSPGDESPTWRQQFPHHREADQLVSRRELLRLAVLSSGALFSGTVVLAILGALDDRRRGEPKRIASLSDLPDEGPLYFNYPGDDDQAVLLNVPGRGLVAYSQKCTHLSCAVYYQEEENRFLCPCHEGVFEVETGEPVAGPPQRRLPRIVLERRGSALWAIEEHP
jgi:Rieske Fe-S protein